MKVQEKVLILKTWAVMLIAALTVAGTEAAPIGSNDVARAIGNWRHRRGTLGAKLGEKVRDVRKVEWKDVSFHVVRFEGGGHLIAPCDTRLRPVVMFSGTDDIDLDERNPALALIAVDIGGESARAGIGEDMDSGASNASSAAAAPRSRNEREWAELLDDDDDFGSLGSLDDICVAPLIKTKWNQREDESGKACYSWYTPGGVYCGCVATALAQIMKHFEWPKGSVEQFTTDWTKVDGVAKKMTTQGGAFDWDNMPLRPGASGAGTTDEQRKAIGKLTSDAGILVGMSYRSTGSGAPTRLVRYALTQTVLGYSNAMMSYMSSHRKGTEDDFKRVMISNFNAKRPVQLGIGDEEGSGGHSIVGDGYGYNGGTLYYHLNMGWGGTSDLWYSVPLSESDKIDRYTYFSCVIYNIYTTEDPSLVILSGRVKDKVTGEAVTGQRVVAYATDGTEVEDATTDEHGIYSMLVLPGTYTVVACNESQDRRSEYSGSAVGNALRCVTMENNGRNGYHSPYGTKEMGNCADCDIVMETIDYAPEAEVSVGEVTVGTDFAEAVVPVTAKVVHYGQTATSAKVVVTLTPVGGGGDKTWESDALGDFAEHGLNATFMDLVAGTSYRIEAKVVMIGTGEQAGLGDGGFSAAREFVWFDESATSFTAAKWTGGKVEIRDNNLLFGGSNGLAATFTPEPADASSAHIVIKIRKSGAYEEGAVPTPDGPAAVSAVFTADDRAELVVWGNGAWHPTGIMIEDESVSVDVAVDLDFVGQTVKYGVNGSDVGDFNLSDSVVSVSSVSFAGYTAVSELQGTAWNANLVRDTNGVEYANYEAAKASGATGVLSPLWLSTWNLAGGSGTLDVKDPDGLITFVGASKVLRSETQPDGSERKWYAEASDADVDAGAKKYIKTTVDLGLAKAITDESVIKIGDYLVANGEMSFFVKVGDETVARETVKNLVEVRATLENGSWTKPSDENIRFKDGKVVVTPNAGGASGFARVRVPADPE